MRAPGDMRTACIARANRALAERRFQAPIHVADALAHDRHTCGSGCRWRRLCHTDMLTSPHEGSGREMARPPNKTNMPTDKHILRKLRLHASGAHMRSSAIGNPELTFASASRMKCVCRFGEKHQAEFIHWFMFFNTSKSYHSDTLAILRQNILKRTCAWSENP